MVVLGIAKPEALWPQKDLMVPQYTYNVTTSFETLCRQCTVQRCSSFQNSVSLPNRFYPPHTRIRLTWLASKLCLDFLRPKGDKRWRHNSDVLLALV